MFKNRDGQRLILGSSSPRRRELLLGCGLHFEIHTPDIDEQERPGELPEDYVGRLAREKGDHISRRFPNAWVVAADTTVVCDGEILGKPRDRRDAERMLQSLQGRWHTVWGGIAILNGERGHRECLCYCSEVAMRSLVSAEIASYVASGEPLDKAGSYAIQGIGASLVREVKGSYTNIVGLNIFAVIERLQALGVIEVVAS